MNEEPKSLWKQPLTGPRKLLAWIGMLTVIAFVTFLCLGYVADKQEPTFALVISLGVAIVGALMFLFLRWLCCWRNFRKFLFGVACFATLIALACAVENWRGKRAWENFQREWEAKGERFDRASVVPPPVPDDQNFAMAPIWVESMKAVLGPRNAHQWFGNKFAENGRTNFTDRLAMNIHREANKGNTNLQFGSWQKATPTDLKPWQDYYRNPTNTNSPKFRPDEFPISPQPQSPAADVLLALSKYDSAIEELRQAGRLPFSRFPLAYNAEDTTAILLPHYSALKRCSRFLELRARAELQNGQAEKALDDMKLLLRLTDSIRTEPFLISHLVRLAMMNIALQPIWEGLAEHRWSDAQLAELQSELGKLDFLKDYQLAMRGELILFQIGTRDYLRRHPERFPDLGVTEGYSKSFAPARLLYRLVPTGWFYQNQLRCARTTVQHFLPLADVKQRVVSPAAVRRADAVLEAEFTVRNPYNFLEGELLPVLGKAVNKFAIGQSFTDLARVAIALERYHLAHGAYPEALDALAPTFINRLPHDIINGQPLHYRRTDGGQFILYSVGWNESDDGGVVAFKRSRSKSGDQIVDQYKGDWVWRYPAQSLTNQETK